LDEAVTRVKNLYLLFKKHHIKVIRMGLQASENLEERTAVLAGPYHPAFGHLVYSEVFYDAAQKAIASFKSLADSITICVNPRSISKMRGLNNKNIERLKKRYSLKSIAVIPNASLAPENLIIETQNT
jgi:hypothetical protein